MQKHILIVDDEMSIRCSIAFLMKNQGYKVSESSNGAEALMQILKKRATEEPFDLILTDNQMPEMTGAELIQALKKHRVSLPIIVISAALDRDMVTRFLEQGCCGVIRKPFHLEELLEKTAEALTRKERPGKRSVKPGRKVKWVHAFAQTTDQ